MNYNQTIDLIKKFLGSSEALQTFGPRVDQFGVVVCMIERHVEESEKMGEGRSVCAGPDQATSAQASIEFIKSILLEVPVTKGLADFCNCFCVLIENWINNCARGETRLANDVRFVQRFINYHLTSKEILEILPVMLQKIRSIGQIGLPSVGLARHFLSVLDEERKKEAADGIHLGRDNNKGCDAVKS